MAENIVMKIIAIKRIFSERSSAYTAPSPFTDAISAYADCENENIYIMNNKEKVVIVFLFIVTFYSNIKL